MVVRASHLHIRPAHASGVAKPLRGKIVMGACRIGAPREIDGLAALRKNVMVWSRVETYCYVGLPLDMVRYRSEYGAFWTGLLLKIGPSDIFFRRDSGRGPAHFSAVSLASGGNRARLSAQEKFLYARP